MSAQDQTEKVLRKLHVLLSKSEPYDRNPKKVIIDKEEMLGILSELNTCIYEIMEEYELTQRSRDKAEREFRKQGDDIVWNASRKAEDIYAASVMYTDEALNRVYEIMRNASLSIADLYKEMDEKLKAQEKDLRTNQIELKSQLQGLVDTEKYLTLIEQRNREIKKQEAEGKKGKGTATSETNIYADRQTGIKINTEYLEKMGYSVGGSDEEEEEATEIKNTATKAEEKSAVETFAKKKSSTEEKKPSEDLSENTPEVDMDEDDDDDEVLDIKANVDFRAFESSIKGEDEEEVISEEEARMRAELDADYFEWVDTEGKESEDKAEDNEPDTDELTGNIQNVLKKLRKKNLL